MTLRGKNLFQPGTAALQSDYEPVVARIAAALKTQPGRVVVAGHTDNTPIRTPRFHSNYELSVARAQSVMNSLIAGSGDPGRYSAEGRGQDEPLVSNNSAESRARNRRVDITLFVGNGK